MLTICATASAAMPQITVRGDRLYAGARPWRAWGMNWGVGDHEPVIDYFNNPTDEEFRGAQHRAEDGTPDRR